MKSPNETLTTEATVRNPVFDCVHGARRKARAECIDSADNDECFCCQDPRTALHSLLSLLEIHELELKIVQGPGQDCPGLSKRKALLRIHHEIT